MKKMTNIRVRLGTKAHPQCAYPPGLAHLDPLLEGVRELARRLPENRLLRLASDLASTLSLLLPLLV